MQVSYGPPGHKGVTHLMAVGASDLDDASTLQTDLVIKSTLLGSAAIAGLGMLVGSRKARDLGLGGVIALLLVRHWTRGKQVVEVSKAPAATSWY
jgi:hypothetical protein